MPVRLVKPYNGQAINTLYWAADQATLRTLGIADDRVELASDYTPDGSRTVTDATAIVSQNAHTYRMNSGSAQTLTLNRTGYFAKEDVLTIVQVGAGATTIVAGTGVTITPGNGLTGLVTQGANRVAQLIKGDGDTWTAIGGLGT